MERAAILGVGAYSPDEVVTNADLEQLVETSDEWIVQRTGIRQRHRAAPGQAASDLVVEAARVALERAETSPDELDLIIVGTVTPDMPLPSTACFVQAKLGASKCIAFDVAAACAGFVYGLSLGEKFIRTGEARRVLVAGVEVLTRVLDWSDRNTCVLFGDGAGAVVLGPSPDGERGIVSTHLGADGEHAHLLEIPGGGSAAPTTPETVEQGLHFVKMDGRGVFRHAVRRLSEYAKIALEHNGLTADDIDLVVAHQANVRILKSVADRCGLPMEKVFLNIDRYGNTSSASVPIALEEALQAGRVRAGDKLLLLAMGGGFAYGSAVVHW